MTMKTYRLDPAKLPQQKKDHLYGLWHHLFSLNSDYLSD